MNEVSRSPKRSIALVIQRYGSEIVGGAEAHAALLVQNVFLPLGLSVDIYTTTSKSHLKWDSHFPEGEQKIGPNLTVRRFRPKSYRRPLGMRLTAFFYKVFQVIGYRSRLLEKLWTIFQGPFCPQLIKELQARGPTYVKIVYFSYLYHPTLFGLPAIKGSSLLIPTAHDEFPFYFKAVKELFQKADFLMTNSGGEEDLICQIHGAELRQKMQRTGVGLNFPWAPTLWQQDKLPRKLVFLGRVGRGKGVDLLINYFLHLSSQAGDRVTFELVLAGEREEDLRFQITPLFVTLEHYLTERNGSFCVKPSV